MFVQLLNFRHLPITAFGNWIRARLTLDLAQLGSSQERSADSDPFNYKQWFKTS